MQLLKADPMLEVLLAGCAAHLLFSELLCSCTQSHETCDECGRPAAVVERSIACRASGFDKREMLLAPAVRQK
jgi:hypothetical protein